MQRPLPSIALLLAASLASGCGGGVGHVLDEAAPAPSGESGAVAAVALPVITVNGSGVTITCSTPGASLYYTLDGTDPSNRSSIYSGPFFATLEAVLVIKAIATKSGYADSPIASRVVRPVAATFSESFTENPGWTVTNEGTGNVWIWDPLGFYRIDYSSQTRIEDSRLIGPSLYLPGFNRSYLLVFDEVWHGGYTGYWSDGEVLASADGGASWDLVIRLHHDTGQGSYTVTQQVVVDVSAYAGRTVQFAFRYHGNYDWDWTIDSFAVVGSN
jgi:hypothetical protein